MKKYHFGVHVETEKETGKLLAVYLQFREGRAVKVRELANGNAFANYGVTGKLLGIELLGPCDIKVLDKIAVNEQRQVKRFIHETLPQKMVLAS